MSLCKEDTPTYNIFDHHLRKKSSLEPNLTDYESARKTLILLDTYSCTPVDVRRAEIK